MAQLLDVRHQSFLKGDNRMLDDQTPLRSNRPEIAAKIVDGEAILINLNSGVYYSLGGSGPFVWAQLDRGTSIPGIVDAVADHFGVNGDTVADDVRRLVNELVDEGLAVTGEPLSTGSAANPETPSDGAGPATFEVPILTKYDDMAEIFALDPPLPELPPLPGKDSP